MKIDSNNVSKTFCILPWIHTAIDPTGGVKPCCMYSPYDKFMGELDDYESLEQLFNNENYIELRKQLLSGKELPAGCVKCANEEIGRGTSYRLRSNNMFKHHIDNVEFSEDGTAEFKQAYIDYRFTNKCNHKCLTCGPTYSSLHATDLKKRVAEKFQTIGDSLVKQFKIDPVTRAFSPLLQVNTDKMFAEFKTFYHTVEKIYFAGGEPLIADHHYEILDLFIEQNQPISISYNTNFSELNYKNQNVIEKWRRINGPVSLYASIDGIGKFGEVLREGFDTNVFQDNIAKVLAAEVSNLDLGYNITFGLTNILNVVETVEWLETQHIGYERPNISFNPIHVGEHFSFAILDDNERQEVYNIVKAQVEEFARKNINNNGIFRANAIKEQVLGWVLGAPKFNDDKVANVAADGLTMLKNAPPNWGDHFPFLLDVLTKKSKRI